MVESAMTTLKEHLRKVLKGIGNFLIRNFLDVGLENLTNSELKN